MLVLNRWPQWTRRRVSYRLRNFMWGHCQQHFRWCFVIQIITDISKYPYVHPLSIIKISLQSIMVGFFSGRRDFVIMQTYLNQWYWQRWSMMKTILCSPLWLELLVSGAESSQLVESTFSWWTFSLHWLMQQIVFCWWGIIKINVFRTKVEYVLINFWFSQGSNLSLPSDEEFCFFLIRSST